LASHIVGVHDRGEEEGRSTPTPWPSPRSNTAPARPPTCPRRSRTSGSTPAGCLKRTNPRSGPRKQGHRNGRADHLV